MIGNGCVYPKKTQTVADQLTQAGYTWKAYIDGMGTTKFAALAQSLAAKHGERFKPNPLLIEMAGKGETFYGRLGEKAKAA